MIKELAGYCIRILNYLPKDNGLSYNMSAVTVVMGMVPLNYKDMKVEYGQYIQDFKMNTTTN